MAGLDEAILGKRRGQAGPRPLVEGVIISAGAEGATFAVPAWDGGAHEFGPAPYPGATAPAAGARCLVAFVGPGVGNPWVIGLWA